MSFVNTNSFNPVLSGVASSYPVDSTLYIHEQVVPVRENSPLYTDYQRIPRDKSNINTKVGDAGLPSNISYSQDTVDVILDRYALAGNLTWRQIKLGQERGQDIESRFIMRIRDLYDLDCEIELADIYTDSSNYNSGFHETVAAADKLDASTAPDVVKYIRNKLNLLRDQFTPNIMIVSREVWTYLSTNEYIIKAINGTMRMNASDAGVAMEDQVARIFGLDKVIVGKAQKQVEVKDSSNVVTTENQDVWGKHLVLLYKPMSLDYVPFHTALFKGGGEGSAMGVERFWKPEIQSFYYILNGYRKFVSNVEDMAYLAADIIS